MVLYAPTRGSDQLIPSLDQAWPPCCTLGLQPPGRALISMWSKERLLTDEQQGFTSGIHSRDPYVQLPRLSTKTDDQQQGLLKESTAVILM